MKLHLSTVDNDDTLCGQEKCRAATQGWMDVEQFPDQPKEGDDFVAKADDWTWCGDCREKVTT